MRTLACACALAALCLAQSLVAPQVGESAHGPRHIRDTKEYPVHDPDAKVHQDPNMVNVTRKQKEGLSAVHQLLETEKYKAALTAKSTGVANEADEATIKHHEDSGPNGAAANAAKRKEAATANLPSGSAPAAGSAEGGDANATKADATEGTPESESRAKVRTAIENARSEAAANITASAAKANPKAAAGDESAMPNATDSKATPATKEPAAEPQNDLGEGAQVEFEDHRLPECLKILQADNSAPAKRRRIREGERVLGEDPAQADAEEPTEEQRKAEEEAQEKEDDENMELETESSEDRVKECMAIVRKSVNAVLDASAALEVQKATLLREAHIAHIPAKLDDRDYGIKKTARPIEGASSAQVGTMTGIAADADGNKQVTEQADEVAKGVEKTIDEKEGGGKSASSKGKSKDKAKGKSKGKSKGDFHEKEEEAEEEAKKDEEKKETEAEAGIVESAGTKSQKPVVSGEAAKAADAHKAARAEKEAANEKDAAP